MKIRGVAKKGDEFGKEVKAQNKLRRLHHREAKIHSDARQNVFKSHAGGYKIFGWEQLPPAQPFLHGCCLCLHSSQFLCILWYNSTHLPPTCFKLFPLSAFILLTICLQFCLLLCHNSVQ